MYKNQFKTYCFAILCLITSNIFAQQAITARENETLMLQGTTLEVNQSIQWQESTDNSNWNNISGGTTLNYEVTLQNLPKYYRAVISDASCNEDIISEIITVNLNSTSKLLWSDPNTWGAAGKPIAGDDIVIPDGIHIYLDENTPSLGEVVINGTLEFERQDLEFTSRNITINGGELIIGNESNPFNNKAIITLTDQDTNHEIMGTMGTRGIVVVQDGSLELHGVSPDVIWTKINAHIEDGANQLTLATPANDWNVGDEIVLGPTDYYEAANGESITQKIPIATNNNGTNITLAQSVEAFHWGLLQYATENGMSLTPQNLVANRSVPSEYAFGIQFENPKILDQRAPVGNLTRNIVIQAPDDATWNNQGFGVHIMIMPSATAHLDGVEIKRAGQRGRVRRYPFHWHMLSYSGSNDLGDATGQFIKNSTINESQNRGIVVHGTNGTLVQNNIIYNVKGHGIFTEDAAERRNTFDGNLVLHIRSPQAQFAIKQHELPSFERGAAGFWISNPDNTTINNHVADSQGNGYWLAFPLQTFGSSSQVLQDDGRPMLPRRMPWGAFDNNTAHSCKEHALHNDNPENNEAGNTTGSSLTTYVPDVNIGDDQYNRSTWRRFDIRNFTAWKSKNAIWERVDYLNNIQATAADNQDTYFAGSGFNSLIIGALTVGRSLNHGMNSSPINNQPTPAAFATYHHTFNMMGNIGINFSATSGTNSGMFSTEDYYLRPVEKGHWLSFDNHIINSHPGVKLTANEAYGSGQVNPTTPHFNLAGAMWDPHGFWGPENQYIVFDTPFYTYNSQITQINGSNSATSGGVSVPGPFYGFDEIGFSFGYQNVEGQRYTRYDDNLNVVDSFTLAENGSGLLEWMKDAALHKDGIYSLEFPEDDNVTSIVIGEVTNMLSSDDEVILGIEFDGNTNCNVSIQGQFGGGNYNYPEVSNFEAVRNASSEVFWQDNANDMVWIKIKGGRFNQPSLDLDFWESHVYIPFQLHLNSN